MHFYIWIIALSFAVGVGSTIYLLDQRVEAAAAEAQRLEALVCWHEVTTGRRLNPGECRFL